MKKLTAPAWQRVQTARLSPFRRTEPPAYEAAEAIAEEAVAAVPWALWQDTQVYAPEEALLPNERWR